MIVPLSLTFSGDFDILRRLLYRRYSHNWFSSFGRIPAALFSADVRVRNTIHLGHKGGGQPTANQMSTVLHRWFEEARPHLFENLAYASVLPLPFSQLVAKVGSSDLASAMERTLTETRKTVDSHLVPYVTNHALHFKMTAYNWLCFCREQPPSFDSKGRPIPQSAFGTIYFRDSESRDLAFLLLNGKIMFGFWAMIGDDFHLARWVFANFPVDFFAISAERRAHLLPMADLLETLMKDNATFKLNAGKRVGNYNLARCRAITDQSDAIFAEHLGLDAVWDDIELLYAQIVRTDFEEAAVA